MMKKTAGFLLPYAAVATGLFVFHSAWLAILSYHSGIIAIVLLSKKRVPLASLFKSRNHKTPVFMAVTGLAAGILLYVLWSFLADSGRISEYTRNIGLDERTWPSFIAYFVLANAWFEEF